MDKEEIMSILPHRAPMLLVDEMYLEGEESVSRYKVKGDEYFLQGHFPDMPVVPGVILCEMMGQGAAILLAGRMNGSVPMFVGMDNVRFKHVVRPGDVVECRARLANSRGHIVMLDAMATVDGLLCCSAKLSVALIEKD